MIREEESSTAKIFTEGTKKGRIFPKLYYGLVTLVPAASAAETSQYCGQVLARQGLIENWY